MTWKQTFLCELFRFAPSFPKFLGFLNNLDCLLSKLSEGLSTTAIYLLSFIHILKPSIKVQSSNKGGNKTFESLIAKTILLFSAFPCACTLSPMDLQVFETNPISHWSDLSKCSCWCYPGYTRLCFSLHQTQHTRAEDTETHNTRAEDIWKHNAQHMHRRYTERHTHKTESRLPNLKLQVIWADQCVWADAW